MKKDWLEDIHDRMADLEVEEPQGLWDDIAAAEAKAAKTALIGNRRRIWIGSTAAAASLLLLWLIRPDSEQATGMQPPSTPEIASTDHRTSIEEQVHPEDSEKPMQAIVETRTSGKKSVNVKQTTAVEDEGLITDGIDSENTEASNNRDSWDHPVRVKPSDDKKQSEGKKEESLRGHDYLAQSIHDRRADDPRLSVGVATSGGVGTDNRQLFRGGYAEASPMLSESGWVDSPLLGIMALNRGAETERKVTHHAPIRTELSFSYRLNDRWSIVSGISYAFVSSDIHEGSISNFIEEKQELHYIGIPLGATYRLLAWKHLDLYLSADILAEQCVSGHSRKEYIIGEKVQEEEGSDIQSRPMQWSIGATAGVQYNLNSLFSIYAEPGCRYYFDDRSSLETVFKNKVFDFNLNLGLRFTVGK